MSRTVREVYVVDAVRTPVGKYGGALAGTRPDDLAAHVLRALLAHTPALDPAVMAKLTPSFRLAGTVTAGNSSPLDDGAAALLLADEDGLRALGRERLARVRASAVTALDPRYFGLGPVEASRTALARAGLGFEDLTTVELNEAFAAQVLGCLAELPALDPAKVNPYGGALALGHPLGASGARIAGAVAHQLARAGTGTGLATLCIGVGQGLALVLER
ncbi:acetyl-CoA acetyltransferases [Streptomyces sp. TverLS-915]|uniref:thiolase family protein n=1 Tax=Streptomyces sp. TverLS-915 TaxID=1839763 RepID=UPI00081DA75C|nr:thiolase family protein [Streptomyces sp. TverLS-915]SCD42207.1 acetyl-CoA acetyltransferases [Streptomyces sp. TverLS-915]